MATVNAHYQGTYQPQVPTTGRAFTAELAALLTPMVAHKFVPRGVADVGVYRLDRRLSSCLPICGHCWAGTLSRSKRAVAPSCAKTIWFSHIA
jgi:hypothetical protein